MTTLEQAQVWDATVRVDARAIEQAWFEAAKDLLEGQEKDYPILLGFETFDAYLESRFDKSKTYCYQVMRTLQLLRETLDESTIEQMSLSNAKVLSQVPKKKRAQLLEAAKTQTTREFVKSVQEQAPESRVETTHLFQCWLDESTFQFVESVMKKAKQFSGEDSNAAALELIMATAAEAFQNEEAQRCAATCVASQSSKEPVAPIVRD